MKRVYLYKELNLEKINPMAYVTHCMDHYFCMKLQSIKNRFVNNLIKIGKEIKKLGNDQAT